jgi:hypothetical protein
VAIFADARHLSLCAVLVVTSTPVWSPFLQRPADTRRAARDEIVVTGRVVDGDGRPISAPFFINLYPFDHPENKKPIKTRDDGTFETKLAADGWAFVDADIMHLGTYEKFTIRMREIRGSLNLRFVGGDPGTLISVVDTLAQTDKDREAETLVETFQTLVRLHPNELNKDPETLMKLLKASGMVVKQQPRRRVPPPRPGA